MHYWVERARDRRLGRVDWADRASGNPRSRKTALHLVRSILGLRRSLQVRSALGECGPAAIHRELLQRGEKAPPCERTIARILASHGVTRSRRIRQAPPPPGWYLPLLATARSELDSFDLVEGQALGRGRPFDVLNVTSLWGSVAQTWVLDPGASTPNTMAALHSHWAAEGLPGYAQFDNAAIFYGAHGHPTNLGRVVHFCLCAGVIPVFAPPRETGFQAKIESFNGLWQQKVWQRRHYRSFAQLRLASAAFIAAHRLKHQVRRESAPTRHTFHRPLLRAPVAGTVVLLRRANEAACLTLFGRRWPLPQAWAYRLVRCEWDLTTTTLSIFGLRRRQPSLQPLLLRSPLCLQLTPWHSSPHR